MLEWAVLGERAGSKQHYGSPNCKFPSLCIILFEHGVLILDELFVCQSVESNEDLYATAADGMEHAVEPKTPHA